MALRRNFPKYRELDKLVMEGRAQLVATPTVNTGTLPTIVATQAGEVAIITRIVGTALPGSDTSPGLGDTGSFHTITLYDENGDATGERLRFLSFQRVNQAFFSPTAPEWSPLQEEHGWISGPPNAPIFWEPEEPIIVPPKHTLRSDQDGVVTMAGGNIVARGYILSEGDARTLGFSVGSQDATYKADTDGVLTTAPKNLSGFRSGVIAAPTVAGVVPAGVTLVPALAGHCIQIIDMHIRMQPLNPGVTTRKASIVSAAGLTTALLEVNTGSDLDPVFIAVNNNHNDLAEWKMSPGIYLNAAEGLYLVGDGAANVDVRCAVNVTYRYVPSSEVPQGLWWSYASITPPGANTTPIGTGELFTDGGQVYTLFYPGKAAASLTSTATVPGKGQQHVVEGYAISAQKDGTILSDRANFALTTGDAIGNIGLASSGLTTTNKLISAIMCLGGHHQMFALAEDGLNVPCPKDTGLVMLEITGTGSGATTPAANDLDIDEWHTLVWGRTIPAKFGTGHFKGGAS